MYDNTNQPTYNSFQYNDAQYCYASDTNNQTHVPVYASETMAQQMPFQDATNLYNQSMAYQQNMVNPAIHYNTYISAYNFGLPCNTNYNYGNPKPFTDAYATLATRSGTPDKPIMNDSGIETSPTVYINQTSYNAPYLGNQGVVNPKAENLTELNVKPKFNTNACNYAKTDDRDAESESEDDEVDDEVDLKKNKKNASNSSSSLLKPPKPYLEIIADAVLSSSKRMMQLHEIYYYMEKKYPYFAQNVNKSWRNSVRHNLSLNECFVKAGRGTNGKGNYWRIHNICEPDFLRGNFRRKNFKQLIRSASNVQNNKQRINQQNFDANFVNPPFDAEHFLSTIGANYGIQWNQTNKLDCSKPRFNAFNNC